MMIGNAVPVNLAKFIGRGGLLMSAPKPSLYGRNENNNNRTERHLWSKNQFNSTFPVSLCLFMRDKDISPISVFLKDGEIVNSDSRYSMDEVIGSASEELHYDFEESFAGYKRFLRNDDKLTHQLNHEEN